MHAHLEAAVDGEADRIGGVGHAAVKSVHPEHHEVARLVLVSHPARSRIHLPARPRVRLELAGEKEDGKEEGGRGPVAARR